MSEILRVKVSGSKKKARRFIKALERVLEKDQVHDIQGISDYRKIKKFPWLNEVTVFIASKEKCNQPRARPKEKKVARNQVNQIGGSE